MANLIEQMNILKGLDDASLQGEIQSPSGAAPPFLVLTEINRRKDMRQRYEGEQARKKPSTTVVEDVAFGMPAVPASVPAAMPGGLDAAAGMPPQGFASGGLVEAAGYADGGAVNYDDIAKRYNDRLTGLDSDKKRARAMALLAASGAILGGGSSNTLKNVGAGISAFAGNYGDQLQTIDSQELNLLRGITDIEQLQQNFAASEQDRALRREEIGISRERLNTDRTPAKVLEFREYQKLSPEEKIEYDRLNPPYNPNADTQQMRLLDDANRAFDTALNSLPEPAFVALGEEAKVAQDRQKQAALLAYPKWVALLGEAAATAMARQYGVADGDLVLATAPGAVLDEKDPLGLGL